MKISTLLFVISAGVTGVVIGNNLSAPLIINPDFLLLSAFLLVGAVVTQANNY